MRNNIRSITLEHMKNPFRQTTTEPEWRELCGYLRFGDHEVPITEVTWTQDGVRLEGKVHLKENITGIEIVGELEWVDCLGNEICRSSVDAQSAHRIGPNTTDISLNINIEPGHDLPWASSSWVLAK